MDELPTNLPSVAAFQAGSDQPQLKWIATSDLVDPPVVLRLVNRGSLAYAELRDSIAHWGVLTTVLVRPSTRFPGKYDVADGLYRTSCRP